jgi:hypothetical protein
MRLIKSVSLAFAAVLVVSAVAVASASAALPEYSPTSANLTTKGGAATLEQEGGPAPITATSSEGTGTITGAKSGTFDILYLGTSVLGAKCKGLNDTVEGSVLVKGATDLRYATREPKDVVVLFLLQEVHFECNTVFVPLVNVRGCVPGLVTPINAKVKPTEHFTLKLEGSKGKQAITEVFNEAGTAKEKCLLETSVNGGAFKPSSQAQTNEVFANVESEIKA